LYEAISKGFYSKLKRLTASFAFVSVNNHHEETLAEKAEIAPHFY
jgi:hypothetical protein